MNSYATLCDDLTGSSVQSILLKDRGLPVHQIIRPGGLSPDYGDDIFLTPSPGGVMVINCDTRRRSVSEATGIFRRILAALPGETGVTKRIDTTLRGHLFAETAEILSARSGAVALVVPAYPSSGRTTVGGYHLLSGSLLERTEVARDPLWPIDSSYVPNYFAGQFSCALLTIDHVKEGTKNIAARLNEFLSDGHRIIVADAMTEGDIEALATAADNLSCEIVPVDPGPFTAAFLARKLSRKRGGKVLAILGSTSERTKKQLAWLEGKIYMAEFTLFPEEAADKALSRLRAFLAGQGRTKDLIVLHTSPEILKGEESTTARTLAAIGKETLHILRHEIWGILLSGGDTAAMFFEEAGASTLLPEVEIQPLMMGGRIFDGDFAGLGVVTKGGLIGEDDGIYKAVLWLRKDRE